MNTSPLHCCPTPLHVHTDEGDCHCLCLECGARAREEQDAADRCPDTLPGLGCGSQWTET